MKTLPMTTAPATDTAPLDPGRRRWLRTGVAGAATVALAAVAGRTSAAAPIAPTAPAGLLRLDLNESSYGPSPTVAPAVQRALAEAPRYVGNDQLLALQRQIATLEGVAPEQVIVGEVLEALGQHLALRQGAGGFIYSVPGYGALVDAAAPFGGRAVEVPLNAALENDLPALLAAISADTRALFVVNPHNPSGTLSPGAAFDAFVTAAQAKTLVIVDEAYLDYRDDAAALTAVRLLRQGQNVVVFRTLGKIHALAGLQVGYALAPRALADALRARGVGGAHAQNQLSLAAASATLADRTHVARVRAQVATERERWQAVLASLQLRSTRAAGNFVFFDSGHAHAEVAAALLQHGVRVARVFAPYATWVRISIGTPAENRRAQQALRTVLAALGQGRTAG
ncbi:histidinol-phosphate transaminase [Stenotrophomonas sp. 24(2023)]|uniref:pyridoxal phosphate-dependent aminotransferase n=1 Tax=Stenotrophomonas sp. 24(2023) TaxID=3068324 RepID=UPI0027E1466C|nr:histidinol-phosphate transaminase [Stenotrophomonas sp. 24(2023)]WMJ69648.1 histidinol-phosphate transaminase [Stenotrophomonas sp. 24(2023)]